MIMKLISKKSTISVNIFEIIIILIFFFGFVNPYVEYLMFYEPSLLMLSHYSITISGVLIGKRFLTSSKKLLIIGIVSVVFWHLPLGWYLASTVLLFRIISELTLLFGGIIIGSIIDNLNLTLKLILLALWMIGDTALSILFLVVNPLYTNLTYPVLYSPEKLPLAGVIMFTIMNVILIYIIARLFRKYFQL
jgi:hypothetical protein